MKGIKQSVMDRYIAIFLILIIIVLSYSGLVLHKNMERLDKSIKYQEKVLGIAHEMEDISNKLSDLARSFVNNYNINDLNEYWNEINVVKTREIIISKLESTEMPEEKQSYLRNANKVLDILGGIEIHAMSLVIEALGINHGQIPVEISEYELSISERNLSDEEKINLANALVFGEEYRSIRKELRVSISMYRKATEELLSNELNLTIGSSNNAFKLQMLFLVFLLTGGLFILLFYYTKIAMPVKYYTTTVEENSNKFELPKLIPRGSIELQKLAEAFNKNS